MHLAAFGTHTGKGGVAIGAGRFSDTFNERVPCVAVRALALPFGALATAFGAGVKGFWFGHVTRDSLDEGESARGVNTIGNPCRS